MSLLITPNGDTEEIRQKGTFWTIEELVALVGGDVLPTYIGRGEVIYSALRRGKFNMRATNLLIQRCATFDEPIYGNAIVMLMGDEPR